MIIFISGCDRHVDLQEILPRALPDSSRNVESSIYQSPGHNQWTVYVKFECRESDFRSYAKDIGLEECEAYEIPLGFGSPTKPDFWDPQVLIPTEKVGSTSFYKRKGTELCFEGFVYHNWGALWNEGYAYFYFFATLQP